MMKKICILIVCVLVVRLCNAAQKPIEVEDSPMEQVPITKVEAADILQGLGQSAQSQLPASSSAAAAAQPARAESTLQPAAGAAALSTREARNKIKKTLEVAEFFKGTAGFAQNNQLLESMLNEVIRHPQASGPQIKKAKSMLAESRALPSAQSPHIPVSSFQMAAQQPAAAVAASSSALRIPMMAQPQAAAAGSANANRLSEEKYNKLLQKAIHHYITGRNDLAVQYFNQVNVTDAPIEMQRSAQYYLGIIYNKGGRGIDKDNAKAIYYLNEAIKPGGSGWIQRQAEIWLYTINCPVAQHLPAQQPAAAAAASSSAPRMPMMAQPQIAAASSANANRLSEYNKLWQKANHFYNMGQYGLAVEYFNQVNVPDAPIEMQRKAQYNLGTIYRYGGIGIDKDNAKAIYYLNEAIKPGGPTWVRNQAQKLFNEINSAAAASSSAQANTPQIEEDEWVEYQPPAAAASSSSMMPKMSQPQPAAAAARPQYQPSSSDAPGLLPGLSRMGSMPPSDELYRDQLRQAKVLIRENNYGQALSILNQIKQPYAPMDVRLDALMLLEKMQYSDIPSLERPAAIPMQYRPAAAASSSSAAAAQAASSVQAVMPQSQPAARGKGTKRERADERADEQSEDEEDDRAKVAKKE
ncbi:MAG: SEL1-like repeat protein [Candidatus Babeliales bacterium]|nr:SEL1-like repeat protein [Candidatus Babeliales bacterium]